MKLMARYEDNHFDLAIVDPPYGIDVNKMSLGDSNKKRKKQYKKDGKVMG
jgi:site-specific DNA-methyltransferase (adenine-specific)